MKRTKIASMAVLVVTAAGLGAYLVALRAAHAHCDTLDGPVVAEARLALENGDVTPVLKWVKAEQEGEVREVFGRSRAVRTNSPEAKALADTYFFETLVRLHRAGEGEPYTGLKPAGQVEPPVAAADRAIAAGKVDELAREIGQAAEAGVRQRFARLLEAREHKNDSVEAGRRYVEAYVVFVHYVEKLHALATEEGATHGHGGSAHGEEGH